MIVRLILSNFLSFDNETEFNMLAGSNKTHKHHVYSFSEKLNLLKYASIYGANGAGKSNLIKGIEFLRDLIVDGELTSSCDSQKFKLNDENRKKPIKFELELEVNNQILIYGISLNGLIVEEEWLYESGINSDHKLIFERQSTKDSNTIKLAPKYRKSKHQKVLADVIEKNILKSNELLVGKYKELDIEEIRDFVKSVSKIIVIFPNSKFGALPSFLSGDHNAKKFANELLNTFDTGVDEICTQSIDINKYFGKDDEELKNDILSSMEPDHDLLISYLGKPLLITHDDENKIIVKKAVTKHLTSDNETILFDIEDESQGTQRLLDFIPAFHMLYQKGTVFFIDEIDQSIHPALLKKLLEKILNNTDLIGQLIFTTHESNLLDLKLFRQDEIWFAEKDPVSKSSQIYSLNDFKPRYDLDIRKGYLQGRFGGIPFLGHLSNLDW